MPELIAGAQGWTQSSEIHPLENGSDAAPPAVDTGCGDLPELFAYGFDQLPHDDAGPLNVRLAENAQGSSNGHRCARGPRRSHETGSNRGPLLKPLVGARIAVRFSEVLRNPSRQLVCRKIGEDPGCDGAEVR